ncbi:MAG: polyprenyl synthetase family protein, partial [Fidelibacterota bacterium]
MNDTKISELRNLIDSQITEIYPTGPESLTQTIRYVLSAGGKRLRPILTLLSARTFGAKINRALPSAIAVEILHNFTLVHDDIMDEDSTRHGQPTV